MQEIRETRLFYKKKVYSQSVQIKNLKLPNYQ